MSLLNALLSRSDPLEERAIGPTQIAWDRGDLNQTYGPGGVRVDRDTILSLSAVWACVSLIADSIATLPLGVFRNVNGAPTAAKSPGWLDEPNPEQTRVDFIFGCVASLLLHGNAYIYTVRNAKQDIVEAWMLDPRWVYVRREQQPNGKLGLNYYVQVGKGMQSPVGPFKVPAGPDMFHIMAFQPNSSWPMGISPIEKQMMFAGALAGQEMGTRWFSQGFNASGVIEVPDDMQIDQARELKNDFASANSGSPRKMHVPPVLTGGATWKQIQISPEQAQFLQQRQFATDEIARWFRVPPHMIGNLEKTTSWGSGIEEQSLGFVKYTLRPWLERIEASWTRNMLSFQPGAFFRFDTKALERGNMANQADYFTKLHGIGGITSNQIAAELGYPPFEGGDVHYFMVNTAPVGTEPIRLDKPVVDIPGADVLKTDKQSEAGQEQNSLERLADRFGDAIGAHLSGLGKKVWNAQRDAHTAAEQAQRTADEMAAAAAALKEIEERVQGAKQTANQAAEVSRSAAAVAAEAVEAAKAETAALEQRLNDEKQRAEREAAKPKIRTLSLSDGRKGKLLIEGDKRTLELEDGRRVELDGE